MNEIGDAWFLASMPSFRLLRRFYLKLQNISKTSRRRKNNTFPVCCNSVEALTKPEDIACVQCNKRSSQLGFQSIQNFQRRFHVMFGEQYGEDFASPTARTPIRSPSPTTPKPQNPHPKPPRKPPPKTHTHNPNSHTIIPSTNS